MIVNPVSRSVAVAGAIVSCAATLSACSSSGWHRDRRVPEPTPEEQAAATLDAFHRAAARADEVAYFGFLTDDAVFLGTDPAERWTKEEFRLWAEPYFQRETAWAYEAVERHIAISGNNQVAWFDEVVRNASYGDLRGTGVLVRNPDAERGTIAHAWRIAQYNLTFMVPNDRADEYLEMVRAPATP